MTHLPGIHRKDGETREEHDFYATHPSAIPPLLKLMGWEKGGLLIRENSCGQGHLSKALESVRHTVISTDLIDRGYGIPNVDFFVDGPLDYLSYDAVVMNPPYKFALDFVKKSLKIAPVTCAFLRLSFLESATRRPFFDENPPRYVAVFSSRVPSAKNADFEKIGSSAVCYAWFIWKRGYQGKPEIVWI